MTKCPKCNQQSTDDAYCSECGAKLGVETAIPAEHLPPPPPEPELCPDCGTPRNGPMRFCELCRYDFQEKSSNTNSETLMEPEPIIVPAPVIQTVPVVQEVSPEVPKVSLYIKISVDASLDKDPDPSTPCPVDTPIRKFPLDLTDIIIGRRVAKPSKPDIEVIDPAVSHRHLMFSKKSDGKIEAVDLNSTNGTIYNGNDLISGVPVEVKVGDTFIIGAWTRLEIVAE